MQNSKIEWCDHTVNLWWGCYEVNKACDNCCAKQLANRYHGPDLLWDQQGPRMYIKSAFNDLRRYQKMAAEKGIIYRVFINSMSDLFEKSMPLVDHKHEPMLVDGEPGYPLMTDEVRQWFFAEVSHFPNLFFIMLTKRPSNIPKMVPYGWLINPPANVIYMTSCPDQESLDTLLPQLLKVPGKHGLSLEPLIDRVSICDAVRKYQFKEFGSFHSTFFGDKIQWVICGGESGNHKDIRPMHPDWARSVRDECVSARVPFFFKQWGEHLPACQSWESAQVRPAQFPSPNTPGKMNIYYRPGKHMAGSVLDGHVWKEFPNA